jgi:fumarate reductase subunit D
MARSNEAPLWAAFSAGGVVAALVGPGLIFLLGIAGTLGLFGAHEAFGYDHLRATVGHPLVRLVLFPIVTLPMWHWAHRFRYVLVDLGLRRVRLLVAGVCYTVALGVTVGAGYALWRL